MATNLAIDDNLLHTALQISGLKTKKDTVNLALEEFIKRRKMEDVISMFNNVEYDKKYDYKKLRNRK
ncbi:MAG: type II toxin-antitoxin system VapB family antitoxin [Spirochaetaceae bacterium]|nr:type II toxin-antitoxin system VapB family antitoxin [Spirochaetaceae bacterium]